MIGRLVLVLLMTLPLGGCAFWGRHNAERVLMECWDARRVPNQPDQFDVMIDALLVGEPHHGFGIFGRTVRCREERLNVWSSQPQIAEALHQLANRSYEADMSRPMDRGFSPGTGLRMDVRVTVIGRDDESGHIVLDMVGARRVSVMSEDATQRFEARFPN